MPTHSSNPQGVPLIHGDRAGNAAVQALVRALASFDGKSGHRAAHRASLADEIAVALQLANHERFIALGTALLADVAILVTRTNPPADDLSWQAVLGATVLEQIPGLDRVASAV